MTCKIDVIEDGGVYKVSLSTLETLVQRNAFWLLREMEDSVRHKLDYNDDYLEEESYNRFAKWFNKTYDNTLPLIPKRDKRAYSTTHRIEVAYRTKYKCNMCDCLLPPTFEIDHIVEIRDGGKDEFNNLQALCNNCHAKKTRANTLKRNEVFKKEFSKRSREMEENAFEKFKCKKSKYF
tara:strand:- start:7240 stop:7776 length:537 start_codon:yes stop_codon:yes gene_type:complete